MSLFTSRKSVKLQHQRCSAIIPTTLVFSFSEWKNCTSRQHQLQKRGQQQQQQQQQQQYPASFSSRSFRNWGSSDWAKTTARKVASALKRRVSFFFFTLGSICMRHPTPPRHFYCCLQRRRRRCRCRRRRRCRLRQPRCCCRWSETITLACLGAKPWSVDTRTSFAVHWFFSFSLSYTHSRFRLISWKSF